MYKVRQLAVWLRATRGSLAIWLGAARGAVYASCMRGGGLGLGGLLFFVPGACVRVCVCLCPRVSAFVTGTAVVLERAGVRDLRGSPHCGEASSAER